MYIPLYDEGDDDDGTEEMEATAITCDGMLIVTMRGSLRMTTATTSGESGRRRTTETMAGEDSERRRTVVVALTDENVSIAFVLFV